MLIGLTQHGTPLPPSKREGDRFSGGGSVVSKKVIPWTNGTPPVS